MLSRDPVKRSLNGYPYCNNNPANYVDPTGEIPTVVAGGLVGGAIGGVFGFAGSAVSQWMRGEEFSLRKALGSAAFYGADKAMTALRGSFGKRGASSNSGKRLYRVMSEGELNAVKETGALRGGREGTTYFTDSSFKNAMRAKSRLALPEKPTYNLEFDIINSPKISGGTKVQPAYGEIGGGREYFTDDIVNINIVSYQKMIGGGR